LFFAPRIGMFRPLKGGIMPKGEFRGEIQPAARKQSEIAARIMALVSGFALLGGAGLTALLLALLLMVFIPPWLQGAPSGRDHVYEALSSRSTVALAVVFSVVMTIGAAAELVYRQRGNRGGLGQRPRDTNYDRPPYRTLEAVAHAMPISLSALAGLFQMCVSAISLILGAGALAMVLSENALVFPGPLPRMLNWLGQNVSLKWALPICGAMAAAVFLLVIYEHGRSDGKRLPKIFRAVQMITLTSLGIGILGIVATVLHVNFGAR
jgi:hypothetical protein